MDGEQERTEVPIGPEQLAGDEAPPEQPQHNGRVTITFRGEHMNVDSESMSAWKFWSAGKMLEMLGDQQFVTAQMQAQQAQQREAAERQALIQSIQKGGGFRGPRQQNG